MEGLQNDRATVILSDQAIDRFLTKVRFGEPEDCWEWQGARNNFGYGKLRSQGKYWLAHRLMWTLLNEPIPDGLCVMHSCDNPSCVNPRHLILGTQAENLEDCRNKGRYVNGPKMRTHCCHGHLLLGVNVRVTTEGYRVCRVCARERARAYRRKLRREAWAE